MTFNNIILIMLYEICVKPKAEPEPNLLENRNEISKTSIVCTKKKEIR